MAVIMMINEVKRMGLAAVVHEIKLASITQVLLENGWNVSAAAVTLKMHRRTLQRFLEREQQKQDTAKRLEGWLSSADTDRVTRL